MIQVRVHVANERGTDQLGGAMAEVLAPGTVVALEGTLGAGKTRLVQAVATRLDVPRASVTSPTFVLIHEYTSGRVPIYHLDAYRIRDDDEFQQLGPEEYFDSTGITFVEWASRVADCLPPDALSVQIEIGDGVERVVTLTGEAAHGDALSKLSRQLAALPDCSELTECSD